MLNKFFRAVDITGIKFHMYSGETLKKKNSIWRYSNNINRNIYNFNNISI